MRNWQFSKSAILFTYFLYFALCYRIPNIYIMRLAKPKKKLDKRQKHLDRIVRKKHKKLLRIAKQRKRLSVFTKKLKNDPIWNALQNKKYFVDNFYSKDYIRGKSTTISIHGEFGFETPGIIESSLAQASQIIDFDTEFLFLDISQATRIWPSAVTLLCSLKQSAELCSANPSPKIGSNSPNNKEVGSYLTHCGFWKFVNATEDPVTKKFNDEEVIKIKRQNNHKYATQERVDNEIIAMLIKYSILSKDEIERFGDRILTEILANTSEHGISHFDEGWWVIMQYHPSHHMISLAIADNGIGFRNNLMTGLQGKNISLENKPEKDGEFILYALENVISGAIDQLPRISYKGIVYRKRMPKRGSHRGKGLGDIKNECKDLKISLSIISQHGYLFLDEDGYIINNGSNNKRIFAGTMYHLLIKAN